MISRGAMISGMKRAMIGGLALMCLAACGGNDGDSSDGDRVKSGQDVADLVGCSGFTGDSEELYVTEGGGCSLDGENIKVYYFAANTARDDYLEVATGFGLEYLVGDRWAVNAKPATLADLKTKIGGKISSE